MKVAKRIIGRIDVKNQYVIKGIQLEGLRKIGDPIEIAQKLYLDGIDELIFMDAVASLYGRNNLFSIINRACEEVFVPITIGGGIRSLDDIQNALNNGADKVAINTAGIQDPKFLKDAISRFGSQCIVASVECKKKVDETWEAYIENGREETGLDVLEWVERLTDIGAGELFITSIDKDGTQSGLDTDLIEEVCCRSNLPIIFSGGVGKLEHVLDGFKNENLDAISIASALHYSKFSIPHLKKFLRDEQLLIRHT